MAPLPPPQGMGETDYETIEAAVTETVRGRWFLGEFARRNRTAELRQLLDAMARIENVVTTAQPALPPSDPSIRMLMQRVKEIAGQLETLSSEMREAGVDPRFPESVDHQARAVAGMMRGPARGALPPRPEPARVAAPQAALPPVEAPEPDPVVAPIVAHVEASATLSPVRMPRAELPPSLARPASGDPRLAALSALDGLTLAKKLALFS